MNEEWTVLAQRIVQGLDVQPGELIQVRDDTAQPDLLLELLLAIELAGATPLPELASPDYLERLWRAAPLDYLTQWDRHRQAWLQQIDRVVVLGGAHPDIHAAPQEAFHAWETAVQRLTDIEEARRLPFLVVGVPTERRAQQMGVTLAELEALLLPALLVPAADLQARIDRVLQAAEGAQHLVMRTGAGHELHMQHGDRSWLSDDGRIDAADRARGAIVSNLPAGSIYTTVLETQTEGSIWLPRAGQAEDVVLEFRNGRITHIHAANGADSLTALFDRHSGEPRRVSHIGIGLNPHLAQPIGWTLVDEHVDGYLFLALGENRYMGGQNESSLNVDFAVPQATLVADGRILAPEGRVSGDR